MGCFKLLKRSLRYGFNEERSSRGMLLGGWSREASHQPHAAYLPGVFIKFLTRGFQYTPGEDD